jgi:hypothetical protein
MRSPCVNCEASKDSNYYSQYCSDASNTLELSCNCGHPGCAEGLAIGGKPTHPRLPFERVLLITDRIDNRSRHSARGIAVASSGVGSEGG